MATHIWCVSAALVSLSAVTATGRQAKPRSDPAPIVQPGAPGQSSKILTPAAAYTPPKAPSQADVSFMQGMIMHHSQAVEMTELLRTRSHNKDLRSLGERISISQSDEIKYMKQWLEDRGKPVEMEMAGMNMPMPMMPGMLTPQQMEALAKATGAYVRPLVLNRHDSTSRRRINHGGRSVQDAGRGARQRAVRLRDRCG